MNRVKHILGLPFDRTATDSLGLASAYIPCLAPGEAPDLLRRCALSRPDLRDSALRKVCTYIDISYAACHRRLLDHLLQMLTEADSRGRQSLACCLAAIADHVPGAERRRIQQCFLASRYLPIRRRGYKIISRGADSLQSLVLPAWERFGDPECAWLIVKVFPVSFLIQHRKALLRVLSEGWQRARLFLRIAEVRPALLKELKAIDPISYCYVLAKIGGRLPLTEDVHIVDEHLEDDVNADTDSGLQLLLGLTAVVDCGVSVIREAGLPDQRSVHSHNRKYPKWRSAPLRIQP